MNVGSICRSDVVTTTIGQTIVEAAQLMRQRHVGFLVVTESNPTNADFKVVGVLTDRDIVATVVAKQADAGALKVGDVMTRDPLLAGESHSLEGTLRHMREGGVRRVPVVGLRNELLGVLSLDDVLQALAEQLTDVAGAISSEQRLERAVRP